MYMVKYRGKILTAKSDLKSNLRAHNCGKYSLIKMYIEAIWTK